MTITIKSKLQNKITSKIKIDLASDSILDYLSKGINAATSGNFDILRIAKSFDYGTHTEETYTHIITFKK